MLMMNLSVHKPFDFNDLANAARPFVRRLLPGQVQADDPIRVDVHVRTSGEAVPAVRPMPAVRSRRGRMPVGTLLDCYL